MYATTTPNLYPEIEFEVYTCSSLDHVSICQSANDLAKLGNGIGSFNQGDPLVTPVDLIL